MNKIFSDLFLKNADAVLVHGTNQKEYCINIGVPEEKIFLFNHSCIDKARLPVKVDIKENLKRLVKTYSRIFWC